MLSGNKAAKSAINLLKLGVGYKFSKDLVKIMKELLTKNGIITGGASS